MNFSLIIVDNLEGYPHYIVRYLLIGRRQHIFID